VKKKWSKFCAIAGKLWQSHNLNILLLCTIKIFIRTRHVKRSISSNLGGNERKHARMSDLHRLRRCSILPRPQILPQPWQFAQLEVQGKHVSIWLCLGWVNVIAWLDDVNEQDHRKQHTRQHLLFPRDRGLFWKFLVDKTRFFWIESRHPSKWTRVHLC
jgi:hypothetical protein